MIKTAYLFAYNTIQSVGWFYALYSLGTTLYTTSSIPLAAQAATPTVAFLQAFATLELVNALLGLVPGSASSAFMQLFGRNAILFGYLLPSSLDNLPVASLYVAWSFAECIRYPFYALSLISSCPSPLIWLRYTTFMVLYPIGIFSECAVVYTAMPYIESTYPIIVNGYIATPALSYAYCCFEYGVCGVALFKYMLRQRQKVLGGGGKERAEKAKTN